MNIIHLVSNKVWGGGEQYVYDLAQASRNHGHHVSIACRNISAISDKFKNAQFNPFTWPLKGAIDAISPILLARCLRKLSGPTVIHAHNLKDAITAVRGKKLSQCSNVSIVLTRHLAKPGPGGWFYTYLYNNIDVVIFASQVAMDAFLSSNPIISSEKIHLIPHGIHLPPTQTSPQNNSTIPSTNPPHFPIQLMYHGRIAPEKGLDVLFKALPLVKTEHFCLHIVGTGHPSYVQYLTQLARELGVESKIHWAGHTDHIHDVLPLADIGVFPSRAKESFGLSLVEYMAHGIVVVASDSGAQAEIITHGDNGFLFPTNSHEQLAAFLNQLVQNPTLRRDMGRQAQETFVQKYTFEGFYHSMEQIYGSCSNFNSPNIE